MFSSSRCVTALLVVGVLTLASTTAFAQNFTRATTTFPAGGSFVPNVSVAFGNGVFVGLGLKGRSAAATNTISAYTSTDGNVWTERVITIPNVGLNNHGVVRFIGGQFIFTGRTTTPSSYVARSADGIAWTITNPDNLSPLSGFSEIVTGGGTTVGLFGTTLSSSADSGATWSARTAPGITTTTPYNDIAYGAGRFVLVTSGSPTRVWNSPDGKIPAASLTATASSSLLAPTTKRAPTA